MALPLLCLGSVSLQLAAIVANSLQDGKRNVFEIILGRYLLKNAVSIEK